MVGLAAVGFEALSLVALGLVAVRFKQHQVHPPDAAESTSVTKTAECNDTKTNVRKAAGCVVSHRHSNLPILRID